MRQERWDMWACNFETKLAEWYGVKVIKIDRQMKVSNKMNNKDKNRWSNKENLKKNCK